MLQHPDRVNNQLILLCNIQHDELASPLFFADLSLNHLPCDKMGLTP